MAIPTPAQTIIDTNSDPALTVYGDSVPGVITSGNVTVNITNVEEITQTSVINQTLNNAAGGTNSSVQFNINNQLVGDSGLTYDPNTDNLTVAGNVTAGNFVGSGSQLRNLPAGNIIGSVAVAQFASTAETVSNSSQPNITTIGTLNSLNVSGNAAINTVKTNNLQYANGEPWIFDLGTGNILFAGSTIYSESNSTILISPSYSQNASATISVPSDADAVGNNLSITNQLNGVTVTTGNGNATFNYNFSNTGSLSIPGSINVTNAAFTLSTNTANNITLATQNGNDANSVTVQLDNGNGLNLKTANGTYVWSFDDTGNVTLPSGNPTIIGGGNTGIDGYGILNLIPDSTVGLVANNQTIIIDPVGTDEIHIRAGGTPDASGSELYLGAQNTFVRLSDTTGAVTLRSNDLVGNTFDFAFSNTGNLNVPSNFSAVGNIIGGRLQVSGNVNSTNVLSTGIVSATGNISGGNLSITGNINAGNLIGNGSNLTNLPSQLGNFQISTSTLTVNDNSLDITITTGSANAGQPNGQDININTANGFNTGNGGVINVVAGNSGPNGTGSGGTLNLSAGQGFVSGAGGNLSISAGSSNGSGNGGMLMIQSGSSSTGDGGDIEITSGSGDAGGNITIEASTGANTNGIISLISNGNSTYTFNDNVLELPNTNGEAYIQIGNEYPVIMSYGSGSHGGPEISWLNADDPITDYGNVSVIRNTLYLNNQQFYVGFNENGNVTPGFNGAFTMAAADGLVTAPADMSVIGNLAAGNITTIGSGGNISGANVVSANLFQGNLSALGNIEGNIVVGNFLYGDGSNIVNVTSTGFSNGNSNIGIINNANITFSSAGNANVLEINGAGAVFTGYLSVTGDISAANLVGPHTAGNSNIVITTNGNITFTSNSNATMVVTNTGANVTGYVDATYFVGDGANLTGITLANLDNGNSNVVITANANVTVSSNGNANVVVVSGQGANVTGWVDATYFVGDGANLTGITLANLDNGNSNVVVSANGNVTITSVSNATMTITDTGTNVSGYVDATYFVGDGANLTGITLANLDNGNSNIVITANANITFTSSANATMVITDLGANITGYANVSGNANIGNIGTGGIVSATGNITGAKVSATVAIQLPVYADGTARDAAITSPAAGMLVFSTADGFQGYDGSAWGNITLT
jgi:hypothetical protein